MDLEKFGEVMDKVITETDAVMLVEMPAGTQEATVKCNLDIGPVGELYFVLAVIPQVMKKLDDMMESELDRKSFAKAVTEMMYKEMVEDAG